MESEAEPSNPHLLRTLVAADFVVFFVTTVVSIYSCEELITLVSSSYDVIIMNSMSWTHDDEMIATVRVQG